MGFGVTSNYRKRSRFLLWTVVLRDKKVTMENVKVSYTLVWTDHRSFFFIVKKKIVFMK